MGDPIAETPITKIGRTSHIAFISINSSKENPALIDSGADGSSISMGLVYYLGLQDLL